MGELPKGGLLNGAVLDTHTAIWYLVVQKLSPVALRVIEDAVVAGEPVCVASISFVEMVYLAERGRLPKVALERLIQVLTRWPPAIAAIFALGSDQTLI